MFFRIHLFQGPHFLGSRFFRVQVFRVQVFHGPGFSGSRVQGPGPGFRASQNIKLLSNDNIKEEHLGIKKFRRNRKVNSVFAKNLLNFIKGN